MNTNNGKTGNVNIPGALHSTGGDGDGQIGGVVAYAGDVYDENLNANQAEINKSTIKLNEYNKVNVSYPISKQKEGSILCNLVKNDEKILQDHSARGSEFADYVRNHNVYIGTDFGNTGIKEEDFTGYIRGEEIENVMNSDDKSTIVKCFSSASDYWIVETESELIAEDNLYASRGTYTQRYITTPFSLQADGNLFIKGVGGFDGTNSDTAKPLQETLNEKADSATVSTALNDLNDSVNSKLSLDSNNNLIINPKSEVESTATDSLIGGIATVGKGAYAFGFGGNALSVYISGNASDGYQLQANTTSAFDPTNQIRSLFESIYKNTYLLNADTYEKVAKITAVTPNTDGQKISITLDTDLGILTNALYRLENISKDKSFNFGVFGNTGDWSSILGYGSYNTGNYSNLLGSNNYNSKTYSTLLGTLNINNGKYSTLTGYKNANTGNYSILIGYNNKATAGDYPCAIGAENTLNAYGYAIGWKNVIDSNNKNGYLIGFDNYANTTTTAFLLGQKLVCENSRGGFYIGQYNKEYISNDASIANWFAVGCGKDSSRENAIEVKQNGNIYIYDVGGFTGANSDNASIKSLQTVISDIQTSLSSSSSSSSPKYITYFTGQGYSIGDTTTASGENSFAEGNRTTASGEFSHAEGSNTTASGQSSHAEGNGYYIHAYVHSAYTAGDTTIILERRVYPGQYLSRRQNERYDAVKVSDVYSYPSNPGIFEVSLEEGFSANLAYHNYVYIFGGALSYESHAEGEGCTANGSGSHAEGTGTTAFGLGAHSEGDETLAYGGYAHAEGKETLAYGDFSHTEGSETNAQIGGHSEGNKTYAYGDYSHAEGHQTLAYGNYSHAEGKGYDKTVTVGSNYVARQTTIDLLSPVTPGQFLAITDKINKYRFGEMELIKILGCQEDTNNLGHYIVTLQYGMNNSVNAGDTLHIYSAASGSYSHSEGNNTSASGDNSHAEGDHTSASGESSHTEGKCTQTTNEAEHASGKYNQSTSSVTQFSVGVGADAEHRANAFEIDVNGNVYIKGIGTYDGTNIGQNGVKSVQQVIADLTQQIAALSNN